MKQIEKKKICENFQTIQNVYFQIDKAIKKNNISEKSIQTLNFISGLHQYIFSNPPNGFIERENIKENENLQN